MQFLSRVLAKSFCASCGEVDTSEGRQGSASDVMMLRQGSNAATNKAGDVMDMSAVKKDGANKKAGEEKLPRPPRFGGPRVFDWLGTAARSRVGQGGVGW